MYLYQEYLLYSYHVYTYNVKRRDILHHQRAAVFAVPVYSIG